MTRHNYTVDEAADTGRFARVDPDATSSYDIHDIDTAPVRHIGRSRHAAARRCRLIRDTQQEIAGLRAAIAAGWDVGPELAYEEQRLAALKAAA